MKMRSQVNKLRKIPFLYRNDKEKFLMLLNSLFARSISGCLQIKDMDPILCSLVCNLMYSLESPQWVRSSEVLLWKSATFIQEIVIPEVDLVSVEYLCVCVHMHAHKYTYIL